MPAPAWQYHEPDHPGADLDALAEIYDRNMQKSRDVQGEIAEILGFLALQPELNHGAPTAPADGLILMDVALKETMRLMAEIDRAIPGWPIECVRIC